MNLSYIFDHTAELLHTVVRVYSLPGGTEVRRHEAEYFSTDELPPEAEQALLGMADGRVPRIVSVGRKLYYGIVFAPGEAYLAGPVELSAPMPLRRELRPDDWQDSFRKSLPTCDVPVFLNGLLLLHNAFNSPSMDTRELILHNAVFQAVSDVQEYYTKLVFQNREKGSRHNSYHQELRLLTSIEQGNLQMLETCRQEVMGGELGRLAPDMDRDVRNICISVITLVSRAAIRGGVHPELAFSLCDAYIMKIEELEDLVEIQGLLEGAEAHFANMVNALHRTPEPDKEKLRHPLVEKSKDYIHTNLHGKIVLNEVAEQLGTNPCYLSELFKRYEGMAFSEFVLREKIDLAKNLLLYSNASFSEIAANLGFSSQSHLGKHFKKLTGTTLLHYRNQFAPGASSSLEK